jgi:hypothetical protein
MSDWEPKFGSGGFKKKNRYSQKEGDVVFRILPPPKGPLRDKGIWSRFHSIVFGYKNWAGKARPFESTLVKNNKTKMIEVECPATDRLNDLKSKLEQAKKDNNGPLIARLTPLVGSQTVMGLYSVDNNHHMNVIDLQGNIGILKIRHKAKIALDIEIKKLTDQGINPIASDTGRFFVFTRTGKGNETNFKVTVYKETVEIQGEQLERAVVHKLTPEIFNRLETEGADLDDLAPKVTVEEIRQIVAEADVLTGKSPACDRFFDERWKAKRATASAGEDQDNITPDEYQAPTTGTLAVGSTTATGVSSAAAALATTPNITATATTPNTTATATTPNTTATATAAAPAPAGAVDELTDNAFFDLIGVPKGARTA